MDPATHVVTKHIITVVSTLYYTYIILTKPVKFYTIETTTYVCLTYFIVVRFKEILVYAPRRWQDNRPENVGAI
jgi:CDP-glycerol glycerophosphotransferase (TagB/SpsB family)